MPNYVDTRGGYNIWRLSYGVTSFRGNRGVPLLVPYVSHGCYKVVDAGGWLYCGKKALQKHQWLYKETVLRRRWMETILPRFYTVLNALYSCKRYSVLCSWDAEEVPSSLDRSTYVTSNAKLVYILLSYVYSIFSGRRRNLSAQVTAGPKTWKSAVFHIKILYFK